MSKEKRYQLHFGQLDNGQAWFKWVSEDMPEWDEALWEKQNQIDPNSGVCPFCDEELESAEYLDTDHGLESAKICMNDKCPINTDNLIQNAH